MVDKQYQSFLDVLKTINRGAEERETQIKSLATVLSRIKFSAEIFL